MKKIVHLIPFDAIGGVEIAARSLCTGKHDDLWFERYYLVKRKKSIVLDGEIHGPETSVNNPLAYFIAIRTFLRNPPDVLVASLWRCLLVLIFYKFVRRSGRAVVFLHASTPAHFLDDQINKLAMNLADEIWTDSYTTLACRVPERFQSKSTVISFLLRTQTFMERSDPAFNFIFWGRINARKGLDRALEILARIVETQPKAHFTIIGPDDGGLEALRGLAGRLALLNNISFMGAMSHDEILQTARGASFYLQTSVDEGMSLAVVESMQMGLVPVVTPVGEIGRYCCDGENAIIVKDNSKAISDVINVTANKVKYAQVSRAAAAYWDGKPLYELSFLTAVRKLLASTQ